MLVRITPGIEADTHESIRTGQFGSKFGVSPEEAATLAPHVDGLHVHVGSQLLALAAARETVAWLNRFLDGRRLDAARRRSRRRARRADATGRACAVDRGVRRHARRRARAAPRRSSWSRAARSSGKQA